MAALHWQPRPLYPLSASCLRVPIPGVWRLRALRRTAVADLTTSVALEQTGLAHILNAEGEKLQAALAIPGITPDQLLAVNKSVRDMTNSVTKLEMVMQSKLETVK